MTKTGDWKLSPAFDMTYSYDPSGKWMRMHQIMLSHKQDNFTRSDLVKFGQYCNLSTRKADSIISAIIESFAYFLKYAKEYDVDPDLAKIIHGNLRIDI
jgi:serine/threonine-protein kinase HipA